MSYLCFQGSWTKTSLRNIASCSLLYLICWLKEKEEDSNLSSKICMLKIQNFNTKQPSIYLYAEKYKVTQDSILNWLSFFSHSFIPFSPPRAEINIRLSVIKKICYKYLLDFRHNLYPQLVASFYDLLYSFWILNSLKFKETVEEAFRL